MDRNELEQVVQSMYEGEIVELTCGIVLYRLSVRRYALDWGLDEYSGLLYDNLIQLVLDIVKGE